MRLSNCVYSCVCFLGACYRCSSPPPPFPPPHPPHPPHPPRCLCPFQVGRRWSVSWPASTPTSPSTPSGSRRRSRTCPASPPGWSRCGNFDIFRLLSTPFLGVVPPPHTAWVALFSASVFISWADWRLQSDAMPDSTHPREFHSSARDILIYSILRADADADCRLISDVAPDSRPLTWG